MTNNSQEAISVYAPIYANAPQFSMGDENSQQKFATLKMVIPKEEFIKIVSETNINKPGSIIRHVCESVCDFPDTYLDISFDETSPHAVKQTPNTPYDIADYIFMNRAWLYLDPNDCDADDEYVDLPIGEICMDVKADFAMAFFREHFWESEFPKNNKRAYTRAAFDSDFLEFMDVYEPEDFGYKVYQAGIKNNAVEPIVVSNKITFLSHNYGHDVYTIEC